MNILLVIGVGGIVCLIIGSVLGMVHAASGKEGESIAAQAFATVGLGAFAYVLLCVVLGMWG